MQVRVIAGFVQIYAVRVSDFVRQPSFATATATTAGATPRQPQDYHAPPASTVAMRARVSFSSQSLCFGAIAFGKAQFSERVGLINFVTT